MPKGIGGLGKRSSGSGSLVQAVLANIGEGFMLVDGDDRISLWNDNYLAMAALPRELVVRGAPIEPLIRVLADRGDYGPGDPAILTAQVCQAVRERRHAQGERETVAGTVVDVAWISLPGGYFLHRLRDVTQDRQAARFKDELIATVSHELRTPLTAIIGALGLLKLGLGAEIAPRIAGLIEVAQNNGDRLARLVNDLLDIDRLETGTLDFRFAAVDICALIEAAVEQNRVFAQSLDVDLQLTLPPDPMTASIDGDRILQVMSNLLSNAAKFSPPGSSVRVRLTPHRERFRISVIDRGRGMSPQFRRRLFSRFAQEHRDSPRGQAGTGLGLSICKSIVERHGGEIRVNTREGIGTIFHIDLPYDQPTEPWLAIYRGARPAV